jgi:hypothetical protein
VARPYIWRLRSLSRVTGPSVWPLLYGSSQAAHRSILLEARREALQVWESTPQDRLNPGLEDVSEVLVCYALRVYESQSTLQPNRVTS